MTVVVPEGVLDVVMIACAIFAVCAAGVVGYWEVDTGKWSGGASAVSEGKTAILAHQAAFRAAVAKEEVRGQRYCLPSLQEITLPLRYLVSKLR